MEQLNLLLRRRFILITPMAAFIQSLTNDLLYALTSRDVKTGKQIMQLWLERGDLGG